jgi:two-component system CheB/CheR fusion protein
VKAPNLVDGLFTDLLNEYVPAAVLVDANHQVLHVYGDVNRYMSVPAGEAKMNLLSMVHPSIKVLTGTALHKAKKEAGQVIYPEVALEDEDPDKSRRFNLIVDIEGTPHGEDIFLMVFDDVSTDPDAHYAETARTYDLDRAAEERIEDPERKLNYTEENLQATVEELETSNEELQATNEELMAANEELQSTNEELHSVNEELVTVNAELQEKLRQLTELNSDMNNLLQSTEVSTIFLDTELCIRKFTASAAKYVNLLSSDEGRPIHHFAHVFDDIDLHACAQDVLEDGTPIEQETKSDNDRWYRFRALPYLTEDEIVKGVVLTFVDITESKALRGALAAEKQRRRALEAALEVDGIDEAENNGRIDTPSSPPSTPPPTDPEDS